jgi:hypothetical protein
MPFCSKWHHLHVGFSIVTLIIFNEAPFQFRLGLAELDTLLNIFSGVVHEISGVVPEPLRFRTVHTFQARERVPEPFQEKNGTSLHLEPEAFQQRTWNETWTNMV